jgi:hypothetical protein
LTLEETSCCAAAHKRRAAVLLLVLPPPLLLAKLAQPLEQFQSHACMHACFAVAA